MKIIFALLLLFLSASPSAWAGIIKPKVLIYADAGYPPYSFGDEETKIPNGIYVKIVTKIFEQMKDDYDISLVPVPWQRGIDGTKTGGAFGIIPPYRNENKRPWLSYSEPILTEQLAVFCTDKEGKWPKDYSGKKVAINYGFTFPKEVFNLLEKNKIEVVYPKNNAQSLEYLVKGLASCYINDKNSVYYTIKTVNFNSNQYFLKEILQSVDGYLGYSNDEKKFPFAKDFIRKFNVNLNKMKNNGEIDWITMNFLK